MSEKEPVFEDIDGMLVLGGAEVAPDESPEEEARRARAEQPMIYHTIKLLERWRARFAPDMHIEEFAEKWRVSGGDLQFPSDAESIEDAFERACVGIPAWLAARVLA